MIERAGTKTVLVVDDDPLVRETAAALLQDLGYRVLVAVGGVEALQLLDRDRTIDLLFADIRMPDMDGITLADFATALRPNLAVLFATGFAELAAPVIGSFEILQKPYHPVQLGSAIDDALARAA
jgi:CheY-like chemotaxis protein